MPCIARLQDWVAPAILQCHNGWQTRYIWIARGRCIITASQDPQSDTMQAACVATVYCWHLLAVTFCARPLTALGGCQLDLKLPIPGRVAAAPDTGCAEHLGAISQLTVGINLLHV